jgi:hypothetical protein
MATMAMFITRLQVIILPPRKSLYLLLHLRPRSLLRVIHDREVGLPRFPLPLPNLWCLPLPRPVLLSRLPPEVCWMQRLNRNLGCSAYWVRVAFITSM